MSDRIAALVGAMALSGMLAGCERPPTPPRNLVLVSIDTLRADHLGTYGYHRDTSPALDRLAARSTVFLDAVAQAPNTLASHMTLFTSIYYSALSRGPHGRLPDGVETLATLLRSHGFATWGFADGGLMRRTFGFDRGFDHYEDERTGIADILARVERWLDTHAVSPFFLFVHCYDVHAPYDPPPPYDTLFEEGPYTGDFEPTVLNIQAVGRWQRRITPADLAHAVARYDGGIRYTDTQIGGFLERLERRGLFDSSAIVVLSDHGEEFQEHGSMGHWQSYFRPNLHVPLIVFAPGRPARRVAGPVELADVLPTLLELLGLPAHPGALGRSLVPLLDGREARSEATAYAEPFQPNLPGRTVITPRHQLLHHRGTGAGRLFDLVQDPQQRRNVAPEHPDVVARLRETLQERERRIEEVRRRVGTGAGPAAVDATTRQQLEALGYIE
jgi:arylsulfatase A-like enzyme